jgi:hypothetical protein
MSTMKQLFVTLCSVFLFSHSAFAYETCEARAVKKKLAGAAKASFLKKCERGIMKKLPPGPSAITRPPGK